MGIGVRADSANDHCIHQLFEIQVRQTPTADAVLGAAQRLSYAALNARANQMARWLQRQGVGPEVRVAICLERRPALLVGLLGILKAGGAYLPLDPGYPSERLAFMRADAQAPLLLTERSLAPRLAAAAAEATLVCLEEVAEHLDGESSAAVPSPVTSRNLAYVIYTSGSTGRPKGVAVEHRSVVALLTWARARFSPAARAGVLFAAPLGFDLSVFELFLPLTGGGKLILAENLLSLPTLPAAGEVTMINTVPSALATLLRGHALPPAASTVTLVGEPIPPALVDQLYRQPGVRDVFNLYGPTEATVYATEARLEPGAAGRPPIGRPIDGTQVYLLDAVGQPVPEGLPGELCIGGAGLARGYLNAPALTAERFPATALNGVWGERLYRTGDQARCRADGCLEFLGRLDHQVKIRGARIELGEIEAALQRHPAVQEALVAVREDTPGETRLVAYVVPRPVRGGSPAGAPGLTAAGLRRFLRQSLAEAMLPSAYVLLEALPLSPNGKGDRAALPAPPPGRPLLEQAFVAPRAAAEARLAQLWEQLLGVRPIGVNDDFFDLGGNSLLAARLFAELEAREGCRLALATLLEAPTVAALAARLEAGRSSPAWRCVVPIQAGGTRPPLFLVHGIGGNVLGYRELARLLGPEQPFYGLQAPALDGRPAVPLRIEGLAARYLEEIQAAAPAGPWFLGGFSFGGLIAFEMARQLAARGERIALLVLLDTEAPGALQEGGVAAAARKAGGHLDALRVRSPRQQMEYLLARARAGGKRLARSLWKAGFRACERSGRRLPALLRDVERQHRYALDAYRPLPYAGRVTLLRARERPVGDPRDPALGWDTLAAGGVESYEVPGDHLTMIEHPHLRILAERLSLCLKAAREGEAALPEGPARASLLAPTATPGYLVTPTPGQGMGEADPQDRPCRP